VVGFHQSKPVNRFDAWTLIDTSTAFDLASAGRFRQGMALSEPKKPPSSSTNIFCTPHLALGVAHSLQREYQAIFLIKVFCCAFSLRPKGFGIKRKVVSSLLSKTDWVLSMTISSSTLKLPKGLILPNLSISESFALVMVTYPINFNSLLTSRYLRSSRFQITSDHQSTCYKHEVCDGLGISTILHRHWEVLGWLPSSTCSIIILAGRIWAARSLPKGRKSPVELLKNQ